MLDFYLIMCDAVNQSLCVLHRLYFDVSFIYTIHIFPEALRMFNYFFEALTTVIYYKPTRIRCPAAQNTHESRTCEECAS